MRNQVNIRFCAMPPGIIHKNYRAHSVAQYITTKSSKCETMNLTCERNKGVLRAREWVRKRKTVEITSR